ncbi:hypothetical protein RR48_10123 [Papilio machaon]|uniref:Uncharacterized protein n=1 Tax=Papilio machaon TaxID=76193 RepID=A0A194QZH5_PAPMA|nr:hypothetical protein RR48_10123 [Papilio machaon]
MYLRSLSKVASCAHACKTPPAKKLRQKHISGRSRVRVVLSSRVKCGALTTLKSSVNSRLFPRNEESANLANARNARNALKVHGHESVRPKAAALTGTQSSLTSSECSVPATEAPRKEPSHWGLPIHTQEELQVTDEEWSDADSAASARVSTLPLTGQGTDIIMDLAPQKACELLQQGKNALEKAGNMKKECKTEVNECLQSLQKIVLSLSDSRRSYKAALEQEKARAAKELIRCERAHARELATVQKEHTEKLKVVEENTADALKIADEIKNWLNSELDGPLQIIANTYSELQQLSLRPQPATIVKERIFHASGPGNETIKYIGVDGSVQRGPRHSVSKDTHVRVK